MRDFFKGWRRKLGCLTLVMACVLGLGWLRSEFAEDQILISDHLFVSTYGRFWWVQLPSHSPPRTAIRWGSLLPTRLPRDFNWGTYWGMQGRTILTITYSYLAIPSTLLSAYLILWKPRSKGAPDA